MNWPVLVLASASKARQQLLEKARIPHKVIVSNFNENSVKKNDPKELVQSLSFEKAKEVAIKLSIQQDFLEIKSTINAIIACDSVFEFRGEILGKPKNKQEAINRLLSMSSKLGVLHTGHSLMFKNNNQKVFSGLKTTVKSTQIEFRKLNKKEIQLYVESGEPMQCAGCFTLEGEGAKFIKSINGCYSNVIGLSIPWLIENLSELNIQ